MLRNSLKGLYPLMNKKITIAIDAMGGDYAPKEVVEGVVWGALEYNVPTFTTIPAAKAAIRAIKSLRVNDLETVSLQEIHEE